MVELKSCDLPLQTLEMIPLQTVKSRRRLGIRDSCGEHAMTKKLDSLVTLVLASTKIQGDLMNAVVIENDEIVVSRGNGIETGLVVWMIELHSYAKGLEGDGLKKKIVPFLQKLSSMP